MTTIELQKTVIQQISEIDDIAILRALKAILDTKTHRLALTTEQQQDIEASKEELANGLCVDQLEMDKLFNQWVSAK